MRLMQTFSTLPRDKADTLLLIVTCTCVLLPFAAHSPFWITLVAGLLIAWRCWITFSGQMLPDKWLLTIIAALLVACVYLHFHTWFGKEAGVAILILLTCLKLLEMHARRDAMAVIFVGYFLLVGQLLYSQSLLSALYLLFCICLLMSTQLAFQYHQLIPSLFKRLSSGFTIVAFSIPITLVLFLLFPRFESPLWGQQQSRPSGMTGLSDTMKPGNVAELALSTQIAFRVKFSGAIPAASQLYWRAVVLDTFDGASWSASASESMTDAPQKSGASSNLVTQEIIMEPHNQRWLFALDLPVRLLDSGVDNDLAASLTNYEEMRSLRPIQERIRYRILSSLHNLANEKGGIQITDSLAARGQLSSGGDKNRKRAQSLQLPSGYNPLTLKWVQQLRQNSSDSSQLINQVLRFFREQPFRYTLTPPLLGNHQVDDFMFTTRAGFCEHYASAFVVIMRAMGIPAHVVTGYQGGEINPIDGLMTVRQTDAHAWAEVWTEAQGWIRIDPTAAVSPDRIEHGMAWRFSDQGFSRLLNFTHQTWVSDFIRQVRLRWDATNSIWNLWVLNYNLQKQKKLLSSFTNIQNPQAAQLGIVMMMALGLIASVLSVLIFKKKSVQSPLDKLYDQFCQHMQAQGYPRLPYEGSTDYCHRLQLVFQNSKELVDFLALYTRCKYGNGYNAGLDSSPLITLKALLKLCLQLNAANTPSHIRPH